MSRITMFALSMVLVALPLGLAEGECKPFSKPRRDKGSLPLLGLRYGTPQKLSLYAGDAWLLRMTPDCIDAITAAAEPGLGGGQLSVGYALSRRGAGLLRIQESVLRTWRSPLKAPNDRWFIGTEIQWTFVYGVRVGRFYQLGGPRPGQTLTTFSVVAGF